MTSSLVEVLISSASPAVMLVRSCLQNFVRGERKAVFRPLRKSVEVQVIHHKSYLIEAEKDANGYAHHRIDDRVNHASALPSSLYQTLCNHNVQDAEDGGETVDSHLGLERICIGAENIRNDLSGFFR